MRASTRKRLRNLVLAATIALFLFGTFVLLAFYVQPAAAIRISATTSSIEIHIPADSPVHRRLSWPLDNGRLCAPGAANTFDPDGSKAEQPDCAEPTALSGTLWFEPGTRVRVSAQSRKELEIVLDARSCCGQPVGTFSTPWGSSRKLTAPTRIRVPWPVDPDQAPIVLPLAGRVFHIGQDTAWQSFVSSAILQHGTVSLVRGSLFGDMQYFSDEIALMLGDWLKVESRATDVAQGVLQISEGPFFDVSLTVSDGDTWLYRAARDPVRINVPLAAQLIRDPTLIIMWAVLAFIVSGWLRLFELRQDLQS